MSDFDADVIVVGAGSAGCVLAARLSEDPGLRVLLLEAGGGDAHPLVRMPVGFLQALARPGLTWGYESEPEPQLDGRRIALPRGRLLGGSSSINGMFHIRGHRRDFDEWAQRGNPGWSYAEVLPYFIRSERSWRGDGPYHGATGPLAVNPIDTRHLMAEPLREAARRAGHALNDDYDGPQAEGLARGEVAIDGRGRRASTARAYLHPALGRPNLQVLQRAQALRLLTEPGLDGRPRAVGVEYQQDGQVRRARAAREVVLSGGAYGSPQLLMCSGIGPADELHALGITPVKHLPGVGSNLTEHPRMPLQFAARRPVTFLNQLRLDRVLRHGLAWALFGRGPFATQICSGTLLLRTRADLDRPDIQLLCNPVRVDARPWVPGLGARPAHAFYVTVCQLHPDSRGRVSLRSPDARVAPRVRLGIFGTESDLVSMRAGLRAARAVYAQSPMAELIDHEMLPGGDVRSDADIDAAIRALGAITHHPVGTCAMGTGPDAVVDADLRVHGVSGLRVVDASVMPTIVSGNTNAATVMIGEKAADLILGRRLPPADPAGAAGAGGRVTTTPHEEEIPA